MAGPFKMMGWSPFTQKNEGEKLSDQQFDALYEEFKVNYDNAKTEEEKIALRKSFNEKLWQDHLK